ncbi:MAG: KOW domain-containing RNA-binding protein [Peptococcaceae bacterium]|nr:KOW domain-containing RNA-binding protein [Peptococcaceae bacterium]
MLKDGVQIGHLVCSTQGRDSGRFYLVVGIENESRVRVADGEGRKVEKPKVKNVKHLKFFDVVAGELMNKVQSGKRITNAVVRKELKSLVENL